MVRAGYSWPTRDVGSTSRFLFFGMSIDHIFARGLVAVPGVESFGAVMENRGASDHRPVWAILVAPDAGAGGPARPARTASSPR
jgi:endonuclease/exonuclease/phosphatase (EEP) superfamily protein YafD